MGRDAISGLSVVPEAGSLAVKYGPKYCSFVPTDERSEAVECGNPAKWVEYDAHENEYGLLVSVGLYFWCHIHEEGRNPNLITPLYEGEILAYDHPA